MVSQTKTHHMITQVAVITLILKINESYKKDNVLSFTLATRCSSCRAIDRSPPSPRPRRTEEPGLRPFV